MLPRAPIIILFNFFFSYLVGNYLVGNFYLVCNLQSSTSKHRFGRIHRSIINCDALSSTGGLIGTPPTEQHDVSGRFYIVNSKTLFIEDFNYDGGGPGMLHVHS